MDMPIDYHVWGAMLEHYRIHMPKLPTSCWPEWPFCRPYGKICFTSLL